MDSSNAGGTPAPAPYGTWRNPSYADPLSPAQLAAQTDLYGHADNMFGTSADGRSSTSTYNPADSSASGVPVYDTTWTAAPEGWDTLNGGYAGSGPEAGGSSSPLIGTGANSAARQAARMLDPKAIARVSGAMWQGPAPGVPSYIPGFGIGRGLNRMGNFNQVQQFGPRATPQVPALSAPVDSSPRLVGPYTTTWNNQGY
jgi:hypothetical protein